MRRLPRSVRRRRTVQRVGVGLYGVPQLLLPALLAEAGARRGGALEYKAGSFKEDSQWLLHSISRFDGV